MTVTDRQFDPVPFDWCGTLVEYPTTEHGPTSVIAIIERAG